MLRATPVLALPRPRRHPPAQGNLVKLLVATDVTRYLNFKSIGGCYVYKRGAGIHKVPATKEEALGTSLLSLLQKNYLRSLLMAIDAYKVDDPKTWKGNMDWRKSTCAGAFVPHGRLEEASPAPARAWAAGLVRRIPRAPSLAPFPRSLPLRPPRALQVHVV